MPAGTCRGRAYENLHHLQIEYPLGIYSVPWEV